MPKRSVPALGKPSDGVADMLGLLVDAVEGGGLAGRCPVTLQIGNGFVSGNLTTAAAYFEGTGLGGLFSVLERAGPAAGGRGKAKGRAEGDGPSPGATAARHVHLRNVEVFGDGAAAVPVGSGRFWRCRLQDVSGVILGRLKLEVEMTTVNFRLGQEAQPPAEPRRTGMTWPLGVRS